MFDNLIIDEKRREITPGFDPASSYKPKEYELLLFLGQTRAPASGDPRVCC